MVRAKGGDPTGHLKKLVRSICLRTCAVFGETGTLQDERWNADGVLAIKCRSPWVDPASRAGPGLSRALSSTGFLSLLKGSQSAVSCLGWSSLSVVYL